MHYYMGSQYNKSTMRRRAGKLFGFAALSLLKCARYFCILPLCKTRKFLFSLRSEIFA